MPTDARTPVPSPTEPGQARWLHNHQILQRVTGVDPLRWLEADSVEGWNYEWWAVDFGEPDGPRLGAVDVLKRDDPERCLWPHADAVAAIDSAWPTSSILIRKPTGLMAWAPAAVGLPTTTGISESDDLDHDRYMFERAAASTKCAAFLSDQPFTDWWSELDAVGVGYDAHTLDDLTVSITAWPLHPEDCLGELNWEFVCGTWPDVKLVIEGEMMLDRVGRLGAMVDEWCPIPQGNPALAEAIGHVYDMLVEAPELDTDWLVHRLSLDAHGPSWWCRWCPEHERRPAHYVVGGPDGTMSCAAHLHKAAKHEHALNNEAI